MKLTFGQHQGKELEEVAKNNPSYLFTLLQNTEEEYKTGKFYITAWQELLEGNQPFPFGKHKDKPVNSLDLNYLKWIHPKLNDGWLKSVVEAQIESIQQEQH
jgi:uncharacterized protein (DUF3820 family)